MQRLFSTLTPLLAALVLAGCATAPAPIANPLPAMPAAFKEQDPNWTQVNVAALPVSGAWWQSFADPQLDDLVARAMDGGTGGGAGGNTSIQVAVARLAQARALLRNADADRAPQVGIGVNAGRQSRPTVGVPTATVLSAGPSLSYELDLFGRLDRASDAAALDAQQREALLRSTQLLVQAEVARNYFVLRALDEERALVESTVVAYRGTLDLTERRYNAGDLPELDVARARSELAATESDALALQRQRTQLEHALAVLVGAPASSFSIAAANGDWQAALPAVPAGLPSTVLARRPDVAAAQSALLAAQARVGVAQAAWFPRLALTADGGVASPALGDLFKWSSRAWGINALLSLPLFDGGRREAGIANARAELDAAAASYREQVLVAFQDVEDGLSALRLLALQAQAQARAVDAATRVTALSDVRYRNGLVSQLDLLDAQRSELRNRRQALQVRSALLQSTVGLVKALGGGWQLAS